MVSDGLQNTDRHNQRNQQITGSGEIMSFYTYIQFLGDYCDVDIEYEVIDGDDSVGLPTDYEITATCVDENGKEVDITEDLTPEEYAQVIKAIEQDMEDDEYENAID